MLAALLPPLPHLDEHVVHVRLFRTSNPDVRAVGLDDVPVHRTTLPRMTLRLFNVWIMLNGKGPEIVGALHRGCCDIGTQGLARLGDFVRGLAKPLERVTVFAPKVLLIANKEEFLKTFRDPPG